MAYTMIVVPPKGKIEEPKEEERQLTAVETEQVLNAVALEPGRRNI